MREARSAGRAGGRRAPRPHSLARATQPARGSSPGVFTTRDEDGAIVLDGVQVPSDVIIGAGSVVTRDIPPDSLALGSPARVIRTLTFEPPLQ